MSALFHCTQTGECIKYPLVRRLALVVEIMSARALNWPVLCSLRTNKHQEANKLRMHVIGRSVVDSSVSSATAG